MVRYKYMPSIEIHLAIANEYAKKHSIKNLNAFHEGSIAPDMSPDFSRTLVENEKELTHYYVKNKIITNYNSFLSDPKVDLDDDYWKGYFLHLITDQLFYYVDFAEEYNTAINNNDVLHQDYTALCPWLEKRYHIDKNAIYSTTRVKLLCRTDSSIKKTKYLKKSKLRSFIKKLSKINLEDYM